MVGAQLGGRLGADVQGYLVAPHISISITEIVCLTPIGVQCGCTDVLCKVIEPFETVLAQTPFWCLVTVG